MSNDAVVSLAAPARVSDPLTELLRTGARRLIEAAVTAEFEEYLSGFVQEKLPDGRQRVVRNGHLPERKILTGLGEVDVRVPKSRSRSGFQTDRGRAVRGRQGRRVLGLGATRLRGQGVALGKKVYIVKYRHRGRAVKTTIGPHGPLTPADARSRAAEIITAARTGRDPRAHGRYGAKAPTMSELTQRFLEEYVPAHCKPGTQEVYRSALENHVIPRLGNRRVGDIERGDMVALHHELRATLYQANPTIQVLVSPREYIVWKQCVVEELQEIAKCVSTLRQHDKPTMTLTSHATPQVRIRTNEQCTHRLCGLEVDAVTVPEQQELDERGDGAGGVDDDAVSLVANHGPGHTPDLARCEWTKSGSGLRVSVSSGLVWMSPILPLWAKFSKNTGASRSTP